MIHISLCVIITLITFCVASAIILKLAPINCSHAPKDVTQRKFTCFVYARVRVECACSCTRGLIGLLDYIRYCILWGLGIVMSLNPRCYALSQISYLVANITKKNYKGNTAELTVVSINVVCVWFFGDTNNCGRS